MRTWYANEALLRTIAIQGREADKENGKRLAPSLKCCAKIDTTIVAVPLLCTLSRGQAGGILIDTTSHVSKFTSWTTCVIALSVRLDAKQRHRDWCSAAAHIVFHHYHGHMFHKIIACHHTMRNVEPCLSVVKAVV